jgi:hypothetical protein
MSKDSGVVIAQALAVWFCLGSVTIVVVDLHLPLVARKNRRVGETLGAVTSCSRKPVGVVMGV